jgi:hypothetical protein
MGVRMKAVSDKAPQEKPKKSVLITWNQDDTFTVIFDSVGSKSQLGIMLQAAEKQMHMKLARHEI